ncbi:MAG: amino acid dehydrogenase, partial [Chloroflexota bacterium]
MEHQSQTADVVVIGGGVIGTSTAFHLARAGAGRVLLLERHHLSAGATGKSHSLVRMHYTNPHDAALAHASLPYFHRWDELVGAGDPGFVKTGVLRFAPAADEQKLRANVAMLQALGIPTSVISPADIVTIDPGINVADIAVAAWEPESGYADPVATTWGFARAAEQHGASVRTGITVTAIRTSLGRVTGVATSAGEIAAG